MCRGGRREGGRGEERELCDGEGTRWGVVERGGRSCGERRERSGGGMPPLFHNIEKTRKIPDTLGASGDVELDDLPTIITGLKQLFKYCQGLFLIGRYDLHLPDLNKWFFTLPEWGFEFSFEFYALECIFAENRFLGYMLGKWFSIPVLLLGAGVGVLLSNFFVLTFLRCCWSGPSPEENAAAIARKEVAKPSKWSKSSSAFGSFRVVAYVASAYVPLFRYLKGCVIFLILSFAILSLFVLDYFDCVPHPSTNNIPNNVYTHRVFRGVHCYEGNHQSLMPGVLVGAFVLMALPGFVVGQSHALWVARRDRKQFPEMYGGANVSKLKQIRKGWNFLWIGFRENCAYWNAVIMTKDLLFAGCGIYFSGALAQGSSAALVLALYFALVFK